MRYLILSTLLALLALPATAQEVEVTLTSGGTVKGELKGFERGNYQILVDGALRNIPERDVLSITLLGEVRPAKTTGGIDEIQKAIEEGRLDDALKAIEALLAVLEMKRSELLSLILRVHKEAISVSIAKEDAAKLSDSVMRSLLDLPSGDRESLIEYLAEKLSAFIRSKPRSRFAAAFADVIARAASSSSTMTEDQRRILGGLLQRTAEKAEQEKSPGAAARLYRAASEVDPSRAAELMPKRIASLLADARNGLEAREYADAVAAADEVLSLGSNAQATDLREEALYARLRRDLETAFASEHAAILKAYLETAKRPENRKWAEDRLTALAAVPSTDVRISAEIRKYFPVQPGTWLKYKQGTRDTFRKIRTDSVGAEDGMAKVYFTVEDIYKNFTASAKSFQVEIDAVSVGLSTGLEREVLIKFPIRVGETWTWKTRKEEFARTVKSVTETVVTPAGTFKDCLLIEFTSRIAGEGLASRITSRSYYAPNVGLVKLEFVQRDYLEHGLELVERGSE